MKLKKHGLKMNGLKAASGETQNYWYYSGCYVQISYDTRGGQVLTSFHCSLGQNSWTEYPSGKIVHICNTSRHMTMQEIADKIAQEVAWLARCNGDKKAPLDVADPAGQPEAM